MEANQLDDVIQRWRITKKEDLKPEDHKLFVNIGCTCIAQGASTQLLDFIKDEKNQDIVRSMGGGLISPLVKEALRKERESPHSQAVITHLVQICSPNDILDVLLREVEDADPDAVADTIILLMQHIQSVLLRLEESKASLLSTVLEALQRQVSKLPVPYSRKQEKEDKHGLCRCCTALLAFVQPFVQEVKSQDTKSPATINSGAALKAVLLKFCMASLREPLLEAQLDNEPGMPNSSFWNFASDITTNLLAIQESLPKLLFYTPVRKEDTTVMRRNDSHLTESRACLAYLLFVQLIAMEVFPAVFSPVFVLQCNMQYTEVLLSRKDESWILKGLDLHVKSLERVLDNCLPVELLELRHFYSVPQNLVKIMTECPFQHLRAKAVVVFQLFIEKLNGEAKYKFFRRIITTSHHAGVESFILKNIKNQVEHSSKAEQSNGWFEGTSMISLLRDTVSLPQGTETNLLHAMDRVMVSLNLLRYLLIKKRKHASAIWTELCNIAKSYIKTLRVCLSLSKSYYGTELRRLHDDKRLKAREFKEASGKKSLQDMIVKNEALGGMPHEAQEKVLQCALVTYDLMESLVVRIEELIEERVSNNTNLPTI